MLPGLVTAPPVPRAGRKHVAQKPLSVMRELVRIVVPGGLVLDPFGGSRGLGLLPQGSRGLAVSSRLARHPMALPPAAQADPAAPAVRPPSRRSPPSAPVVVTMLRMPRSVGLSMPRSLAVLGAARALPGSDPRVGEKPSAADTTRTLLAHSARDHRRPRALPLLPPGRCSTSPPCRDAGYEITATRSVQWVISGEQTWVISGERRSWRRDSDEAVRGPEHRGRPHTKKSGPDFGSGARTVLPAPGARRQKRTY